ncbi:MAG: thioesterase II family protein [Chloroflexota bacterium]
MTHNNRWILRPRPVPWARLRLFCFPYAGGAASIFYPWCQGLPEFVEVCPIQLPGREARIGEPLFARMNYLLPMLVQAIRPYLDMPFALFGHSLGSLLAFELARHLRKHCLPLPAQFFASGHQAPQVERLSSEMLHPLPEAAFIEKVREMNGTPEAVFQNEELLRLFLPILRADFTLAETYSYEAAPPFSCPITVFSGEQDPEVTEEGLDAWREQTTGRFKRYNFPGDHFFLHTEREELLKTLSNELKLFQYAFA